MTDRSDETDAQRADTRRADDPAATDAPAATDGTSTDPAGSDAAAARAPTTALEPAVEPPSPDVALPSDASPLPGAHRGGFQRLPTAPVPLTTESAPVEPGADVSPPVAQWLAPAPAAPRRGLAAWALAFSIGGLAASLYVGWGFPIGLVGILSGILALRRPLESRALAGWAIVLGAVSVVYSAGWLVYAAGRANLFG